MDVTIKRLFCTPWYQDEGVYGCNSVWKEDDRVVAQYYWDN